jgi:hypothetical protein
VERLPLRVARRIALQAQGFGDRRPTGVPDRRHLRRVVARTGLLQIDSVNVFERAHYLPVYSRLGPYDRTLVDRAAYRSRDLFEYWGHEASLLPVGTQPLLRWRMERAAALEEGWGRTQQIVRDDPAFVAHVLQRVADEGPVAAGALHVGARPGGPWWDWSATKIALEHLFWTGRITTSTRRGFERVYDLTERVLPAEVLAAPTPSRADAQRELVRLAARSHGVATEKDLRDYFRLRPDEAATAVRSLVEEGALVPVEVEGWRGTGLPVGGGARAEVGPRLRPALAVRPARLGAGTRPAAVRLRLPHRDLRAGRQAGARLLRPARSCTTRRCGRGSTSRATARPGCSGCGRRGGRTARTRGRPRRRSPPSCGGPPTGRGSARWSSSRAATSRPRWLRPSAEPGSSHGRGRGGVRTRSHTTRAAAGPAERGRGRSGGCGGPVVCEPVRSATATGRPQRSRSGPQRRRAARSVCCGRPVVRPGTQSSQGPKSSFMTSFLPAGRRPTRVGTVVPGGVARLRVVEETAAG